MQKQDYVRNTRREGVSEDILECFYENISYTPFIRLEDEVNLSGRHLPKPRRGLLKAASSDHLSRATKEPVDPYALILDGKLHTLRPTLKDVMNLEDPYSSTGTAGSPDMNSLHQAFSRSAILQIVSARSRPDAFMTQSSIDNPAESHPGLVDIKVAKVGLLWRKDSKKKKTRSPWQEWGALLTFSQLYLFKDVNWVKSLMSQYDSQNRDGRRRPVVFTPPLTEFKPDAIMSTDDAVALLDASYKKHKHAFLLVRHNALEEIFLANSEADMNDWLAKLNYAATFRTTGVRIKGMIGADYEGQRHRGDSVASDSSLHSADADAAPATTNMDPRLAEEVSAARRQLMAQRIQEANEKLSACEKELDDLLRNARHLQVLTPIHARAREQVILAAGRMAAKVKWVRLDIWRTKCYKEVLTLDLVEEEKNGFGAERPVTVSSSTKATISTQSQPSLAKIDSTSTSFAPGSPRNDPSCPLTPTSPDGPAVPENLPSRRASVPTSIVSSELASAVRQPSSADGRDRASSSSRAASRKLERAASIMSAGSKVDGSSVGSPGSKAAPPVTGDYDGEERILREAGLLPVDGPSHTPNQPDADTDKKRDESTDPPSGEHRGRARRSLHRTLRDSNHVPRHQRSKKGRDSVSSVPTLDDSQATGETEGLSRKEPNFTVHGKKASVITFGSEWQNMSPEQRLKLRKPTPTEESRATDIHTTDDTDSIVTGPVNGRRSQSMRSASSTTARSFRNHDDLPVASEVPELPLVDELKQEQATSSDVGVRDTQPLQDAMTQSDSSPAAISNGKGDHGSHGNITKSETESNLLSGEENPLHHAVSQEKMRHSPHEQAVSA